MIHVHADRDQLRERVHRANMVAVEMRRLQDIDLLETRLLRRREDPFCVRSSGVRFAVSISIDCPPGVTIKVAAPPSASIQ